MKYKTAFDAGYFAHLAGRPYDLSQSQEWRNGWQQAEADDQIKKSRKEDECVS